VKEDELRDIYNTRRVRSFWAKFRSESGRSEYLWSMQNAMIILTHAVGTQCEPVN
jgi:hypothetical protein